jgi:HD superfamily phosphohydrolase YqeK
MTNRERFISLCNFNRTGKAELFEWLERSDFFTAPASAKYHGSYEGGLVEHSLNVYDALVKLLTIYPEVQVPEESIAIVALFHDLCKVNMYEKETRYRKDENGKWEPYEAYTHNERLHYGGHGSKSVFILQNFIKLTPEEAVAINCHMGSWEDNPNVGAAFEHCTLAWLLHVADESATFVKEART